MAEGKFVISAQNRIKEGLDAAQRDLGSFTTAAENLGKKLEAAFTATAIVAGLKKLGEATFDCYKEFGEAERRLNPLKIALDHNDASIRRATGLIENMSKMTLASKDDIEGLVSELAALGKSDDEIEAITRASVNLSNVTGKDLNSAFTLVNATYSGTAGKLDKLLPQIGDLTKEQLAAGGATNLINERFGDLSAKLADNDIPQKLKNIQDGFSDLKENIGQQAAGFFDPMITELNKFITGLNKTIEAQRIATRQMMTQNKFNNLVMKGDAAGVSDFMAGMSGSMTKAEGQAWIDTARKQNPLATGAQAAALRAAELAVLTFPVKLAEAVETIRTTTTGGAPLRGSTTSTPIVEKSLASDAMNASDYAWSLRYAGLANVYFDSISDTSLASDALSASDMAWSNRYAGLAKEYTDSIPNTSLATEALSEADKAWSARYAGLAKVYADSIHQTSLASDALSASDQAWSDRYARLAEAFRNTPLPALPTDGGGFRAQGQSTISGPIGGGGASPAAQIAANTGILDTISQALRGSLTTVMSGMTSFTSAISGSLGTIMSALGPFGNMIAGMNPALALLIPVIDGFAQIMGPVLTATLEPVIGALTAVGTILAQALLPVFDALYPIINTIAEIFMVALSPILTLVAANFEMLGAVIELLSPILGIVAKAFIIVTSPIEFVADMLTALGRNIAIFIHNLKGLFVANQRDYVGFESDAFTGLGDRLNRIDSLMNTKATFTERGGATSTASESASYRTQSITINIYQQAAVVGQAGMTEFARIIRGEFVQLGYMGQ